MPKKSPRTEAVPSTLLEAIRYFADPDVALAFMVSLRWPDGEVTCPTCGGKAVMFLKTRRIWKCAEAHTRRQFSVKVGTIMEDSPIALDKWLAAMWLLANCKNGISSYELARDLDITQKSAWFMLQRIRLAMNAGTLVKLGGPGGPEVEVDETFIGGAARKMNAKQRAKAGIGGKGDFGPYKYTGKATVMAMVERGGKVVAKVVPDRARHSLGPNIKAHVERGSTIHTDEHKAYEALGTPFVGMDYTHEVIDHSVAYVQDNVHTNNVENFWSLLKRGLRGTYISVEPFHLFRYLDEQMFRFNEREATDKYRFVQVAKSVFGKRLTYAELIGSEALATAC